MLYRALKKTSNSKTTNGQFAPSLKPEPGDEVIWVDNA